jgi:hypothetical protein
MSISPMPPARLMSGSPATAAEERTSSEVQRRERSQQDSLSSSNTSSAPVSTRRSRLIAIIVLVLDLNQYRRVYDAYVPITVTCAKDKRIKGTSQRVWAAWVVLSSNTTAQATCMF